MFQRISLVLVTSLSFFVWAENKSTPELETEINALKEQVYKTKIQLREIEESTLRGKITGAKGIVEFENAAEGIFAFASGEFYLDDLLIYKIVADGKKPVTQVRVLDQSLPPGDHSLKIKLRYQGSDKAVIQAFKYFKDYKFDLDATETISVEYGKTSIVKISVIDKGYFKSDIKERLGLSVKTLQEWGVEL